MILNRFMVWGIKDRVTSELDYDLRGFRDLDRALEWAQRWSNRTGQDTTIGYQTYEISRAGYQILDELFAYGGTEPQPTEAQP